MFGFSIDILCCLFCGDSPTFFSCPVSSPYYAFQASESVLLCVLLRWKSAIHALHALLRPFTSIFLSAFSPFTVVYKYLHLKHIHSDSMDQIRTLDARLPAPPMSSRRPPSSWDALPRCLGYASADKRTPLNSVDGPHSLPPKTSILIWKHIDFLHCSLQSCRKTVPSCLILSLRFNFLFLLFFLPFFFFSWLC